MRAIFKGTEPASLTRHRHAPHSYYDNYMGKAELRHALVTEQRGLCCYCMRRLRSEAETIIEHWHCQANYPVEQLSYGNMLGACHGGRGQPAHLQHCDTRKGNRDLQWNPSDPAHRIERRVRYERDGTIRSDEASFNAQLNDVLNLNLPTLRNGRKGVFDGVLEWLKLERGRLHGPVPRRILERKRDRYTAFAGELSSFQQVAVWLLEQILARRAG